MIDKDVFNRRDDPSKAKEMARYSRRAFLLAGGQMAIFAALGWRLYDLQLKKGKDLALLADENRINVQLLPPRRGLIYDRTGQIVARNEDNLSVLIVPDLAGDLASVLNILSRLIYIAPEDMSRVRRKAKAQAGYLPILVRSGLTWKSFSEINVLAPQLPGVQTVNLPERLYEQPFAMAHITGYVGRGNKREVEQFPMLRLPGMRTGKTGMEYSQNIPLTGRHGLRRLEVNAKGRMVRVLGEVPPEPGEDLKLSIDQTLQTRVMELLKPYRRAAVVAVDCQSGEIPLMASYPSFDLNQIVDFKDKKYWQKLNKNKDHPLVNRGIQGQYPPGSTFKMVTALAALKAGVISPHDEIICQGHMTLGRRDFGCWKRHGHGPMNLHNGIKQSCDVYFYELARRLDRKFKGGGVDKISEMAHVLGLGEIYKMGIGRQAVGIIPTRAWKKKVKKESWWGGETFNIAIGQGFLLTNPLQLAIMTARLATGKQIRPTILTPSPKKVSGKGDFFKDLGVNPSHLRLVQRAMFGVVNEEKGTAPRARIDLDEEGLLQNQLVLDNFQMSGKTGTAQVSGKSRFFEHDDLPWGQRDHSLFVGFAQSKANQQSLYAISAIVEHGGAGSKTAAPLARSAMQLLLEADQKQAGKAFDHSCHDACSCEKTLAGNAGLREGRDV